LGILGLSLRAGLRILDEEREIIASISDDLAFALHSIKVADQRRRAEAETQIQHEQLMQADKMVALGTLVSGIGHEINNPNNFIMLNVPLIKGIWEEALPIIEAHYENEGDFTLRGIPYTKAREMLPELLDDIVKGTWRIKRIVGELKDYARSRPTVLTDHVDINEVVRSAIVLCNTFIKQHTQKFDATYDEALPVIRGSSQRIEQMVINLLQNACEALSDSQ
jgi:polar amino acid transport system substrate-binding protein